MKSLLYFVFALSFFSAPLLSHGAYLKGRVVLVGKHDEITQAEGVDVTVKETGDTERTKAQGLFRMFIPESFKTGEQITLLVDKKDYRIQYPLDGEVVIPAELTKTLIEIRLLPVGSKKFWSDDRFEKFIADMVKQLKAQVRPEGRPEGIDFTQAIKEWATNYGFSAEQAKLEIDKWVAQDKKKEDDFHTRALKAFAEKKLGKAESLLTQSADAKIKNLKIVKAQEQSLTREIISTLRLAGDVAYNDYKFRKAMNHYEKAASFANKDTQPRLWAAIQNEFGNASQQKGIRAESHNAHEYLKNSIFAYRNALQVYTRDQLPQDWAMTRNNLGSALANQGTRTDGEQGKRLLAEAVTAYRNALQVRTRDQLPQDWAATQNNLGSALYEQSIRMDGEQRRALLAEAASSLSNALEIRTYETLAPQWAQTKFNLGGVYSALEEWQKAAKCYADGLKVFPHSQEIINQVSYIYHERLFEFEKAYEMDTILIKKLGIGDLSTSVNYIEKQFTTSRFEDMDEGISNLLAALKNDDQKNYIILIAFDIAGRLSRNQNDRIPKKLDDLIFSLQKQPEKFNLGWVFDGTKHYINSSSKIVNTNRLWLIAFFSALEEKNRDAILEKLQQLNNDIGADGSI